MSRRIAAVAIGCSAGGLTALQTLLPQLRADLAASILIVAHSASDDAEMLRDILARRTRLPVREALERHAVEPGVVYVAPPGYHLLVQTDRRFAINVDEKICFVRPAIDVLFETAARVWREQLAGLVLTGANDDGARGLAAIRARGGLALVQDPKTAQAAEMPRAAIATAGADLIGSLPELADAINRHSI